MTPLRQRFLEEFARRNYSPRAVEAYLAGLVRFVRFTRRSPDLASPDDLRRFQLHVIARRVSWSLFNQTARGRRGPWQKQPAGDCGSAAGRIGCGEEQRCGIENPQE